MPLNVARICACIRVASRARPNPRCCLPRPLPQPQGGFTWVTIIMGVLMSTTGLLVLVLRAWVMHDGGLPDGGMRRYRSEIATTVSPGVLSGADDVCAPLGKVSPRSDGGDPGAVPAKTH
jgi:hypothetical protein